MLVMYFNINVEFLVFIFYISFFRVMRVLNFFRGLICWIVFFFLFMINLVFIFREGLMIYK